MINRNMFKEYMKRPKKMKVETRKIGCTFNTHVSTLKLKRMMCGRLNTSNQKTNKPRVKKEKKE